MPLKVNQKCIEYMKRLIREGKIDSGDAWSFSAEDGNALLGKDGSDWSNYSQYHIAVDTSAAENTKEHYKYPVGKDGKFDVRGGVAADGRAHAEGETEIEKAAQELVQLAKKETVKGGRGDSVTGGQIFIAEAVMPAMTQAEVPSRFVGLPLGRYKGYIDDAGKQREFEITPKEIQGAISYFSIVRQRNPEFDIVIDNDHLTLKDTYAPAFGWIKDLYDAGAQGLGFVVDWTELGVQALANKLYKYFSPVFFFNGIDGKTGETIPFGISSAALTNTPFFDELKPLVAKRVNDHVGSGDPANTNNGGNEMKELIALLRTFLGKPETATEDELKTAFQAKVQEVSQLVTAKKVLVDIGLPESTTIDQAKTIIVAASKGHADQVASVMELLGFEKNTTPEEAKAFVVMAKRNQTEAGKLTNQLFEVTAKGVRDEAILFVDGLVAGGKVFPANKADTLAVVNDGIEDALKANNVVQAKKSLDGWKAYYAKMPVVAPLQKLGEAGRTDASKIPTDVEKEVAATLRVPVEKVMANAHS